MNPSETASISDAELRTMVVSLAADIHELRQRSEVNGHLIGQGIKNLQDFVKCVDTLAEAGTTMVGTQAKQDQIQDDQTTVLEALTRTVHEHHNTQKKQTTAIGSLGRTTENIHGQLELLRTASSLHTTALKGFERSEAAIRRRLAALEGGDCNE